MVVRTEAAILLKIWSVVAVVPNSWAVASKIANGRPVVARDVSIRSHVTIGAYGWAVVTEIADIGSYVAIIPDCRPVVAAKVR